MNVTVCRDCERVIWAPLVPLHGEAFPDHATVEAEAPDPPEPETYFTTQPWSVRMAQALDDHPPNHVICR